MEILSLWLSPGVNKEMPECIDHINGELKEIYYENMNTWSHTLIEMMMINANRIVTEHMNKVSTHKIPQRIHHEPISLNLEEIITGDELIDSIIDIQAIEKQISVVTKGLDTIISKMSKAKL